MCGVWSRHNIAAESAQDITYARQLLGPDLRPVAFPALCCGLRRMLTAYKLVRSGSKHGAQCWRVLPALFCRAAAPPADAPQQPRGSANVLRRSSASSSTQWEAIDPMARAARKPYTCQVSCDCCSQATPGLQPWPGCWVEHPCVGTGQQKDQPASGYAGVETI